MGRIFWGTAPSGTAPSVAALIFSVAILRSVAFGDDPSPAIEVPPVASPSPASPSPASPSPAASAADEAATIRDIFDQVAAQREEIFSAKITYRWHLATYRKPDNTPDHVRAIFDQYDLIGDPDSLRELVHALEPDPATVDPPWETRTFHMLGQKRRTDTSQGVIQMVDDDHEMEYEGFNRQLSVDQRGKSSVHLTAIRDFRCNPPAPRHGLKAEDYRIVGSTADSITLEMIPSEETTGGISPYQYTFERATGVLTHYQVTHADGLAREVWQSGLTEYPGGVVIPSLRIVTMYREGRLSSLRVFIIDEAEFNGPVSEELFIMPVPAGTVVVDYRFPNSPSRRTKKAADDVRSILAPVSVPVPRVADSRGPNWRMVLILNGIALIVVATVLWRRASVRAAPSATSPSGQSEFP